MGILTRLAVLSAVFAVPCAAMAAWEPEKPVEFVVPAGAGSSLDQMARLIQEVVVKHTLMKQNLTLVNKSGGAGAEGFLLIKTSRADPYRIMIAGNAIFTTPLATGAPFNWKDASAVAMLALDQFVLWTNNEKGYRSAGQYLEAAMAAGPRKFKMGGTGARSEDQSLTTALELTTCRKLGFAYVPYKNGAEVVDQLAGNSIDSSVSNPTEALARWRTGELTPQCVFDDVRMPYKSKVTPSQAWSDIPTCREAGIPLDYHMLYGIFLPPGVSPEQISYFIDIFMKVVATPEWKNHMKQNALKQTFKVGPAFIDWLNKAESDHIKIMSTFAQEFRKEPMRCW